MPAPILRNDVVIASRFFMSCQDHKPFTCLKKMKELSVTALSAVSRSRKRFHEAGYNGVESYATAFPGIRICQIDTGCSEHQ